MNKSTAAKIIFVVVVLLGCLLIRIGLNGYGGILFMGFALVVSGIAAQVALVVIPLIRMIVDKSKAKKEEEEDENAGFGIK